MLHGLLVTSAEGLTAQDKYLVAAAVQAAEDVNDGQFRRPGQEVVGSAAGDDSTCFISILVANRRFGGLCFLLASMATKSPCSYGLWTSVTRTTECDFRIT